MKTIILIISILFFIQFTQASDELYTVYADGSIQYYSVNKCYKKFFNETYVKNNKTYTLQSYLLKKNLFPGIEYTEIVFSDLDCSSEVDYLNRTVGHNCKDCVYNITENIVSDTFCSFIFSPKEDGNCDKANRHVHNFYPSSIKGKCMNGFLLDAPLSFITTVESEKNGNRYVYRKLFEGHDCKKLKNEPIKAYCDKCTFVVAEIETYVYTACKDAASPLIILLLSMIVFLII